MPDHVRSESATACVLLVEDDPVLRELVATYLRQNALRVIEAGDGMAMRDALAHQEVDLIVLDLMLPGEDGLSLLRSLRAQSETPVIIASARGDEVDRIVGLEVGADDYLAKPFGPRELLARVRAVLRRAHPANSSTMTTSRCQFGGYQLDLQQHKLMRDDSEVALTSGEFNLLRILCEHANRVLSRDQLITLLKGYERNPFDRSVDVRITRLRRKIEPKPDTPVFIRTIWGEGYLFSPQGDRSA
ncbi:MAG: Transcriptional regulatory protein OmpR [Alphaproteobacteria bacterium ADurb.BinA280]|jgi:two-component system phosphate regulon response regulator OmpR|nr:response regulator [Xanthomonadales bacterium]MCC6506544.1 response regulator [Aquimonas sp.]OPZ13677.1 MAG: Transcriptional regulatory protein OmpR [Alphaproteobacteria bacterium ADurb.BinA280]